MDGQERFAAVRRIVSGKFRGKLKYNNEEYEVRFIDPTLELMAESDWIYKKAFDIAHLDKDIFTIEESYQILRDQGKWSDDLEKEMVGLEKDIKLLNENLNSIKFNKSAARATKARIQQGKKRLDELWSIKNQLRSATAEALAEKARKRFIISHIAQLHDPELLEIPIFKDALVVYYFEESGISESRLRELARTDPWRMYWTTSKDTGTPLFPHSTVEMTELQYSLVYWTRVYDFAFASLNRPTEEVIMDDDKFDAWYKSEADRIEADVKKKNIEDSLTKGHKSGFGATEYFIPADAEGAKEVYQLNDPAAMARVKQREQVIKTKGEVQEQALPDVNMDLKMEMNRMASQGMQSRSK